MPSRKLRPNHKPAAAVDVIASLLRAKLSTYIFNTVALILIVSAALYIGYQICCLVLNMGTPVGDNLNPTPWHPFSQPLLSPRDRAERFGTMLKCRYFNCLTHLAYSPQRHVFPVNSTECPGYFQWIYEDLAPWRRNKITRKDLKAARKHAAFRVMIVGGRLYVEFYYACVAPRVLFTLWGFLNLLDKYPGMVPDVDLMFDCMDRPAMAKTRFEQNRQLSPPPLFRYCSNSDSFDIPFPDWSFWGWPQIDIPPWVEEVKNIYVGSRNTEWEDRRPTAYWKGNPDVGSDVRTELLKCNVSGEHNWGAEIFQQNWWAEGINGFQNSKLSQQCLNRFKIYAEGHAWSVSFKYIFSCDSPVLVVSPTYHEFFTRSLLPMVHYWPVKRDHLCPSIKFAVDWGNNHTSKAKKIGQAGQEFMWRNLTMDHVYDYMFHLLSEYSKLQDFKPVVPSRAQLLCKQSVLCFANDPKTNSFLKRSEAKLSKAPPCKLPPHDSQYIQDMDKKREHNTKKIWAWEDSYNVNE